MKICGFEAYTITPVPCKYFNESILVIIKHVGMKTFLFILTQHIFFRRLAVVMILLVLFNFSALSQAPTTTALTSDINPICPGLNITLTATISDNLATGTVEFFDGAASMGVVAVASGVATLVTSSLSVGSHSLTAVYSGDVNYLSSTSPVLNQVINPGPPATPGPITGTTPVCPNISGLIYSISAVADASSYTWSVPPGWSINSGQGSISISATSGAGSGNITVSSSNSCGSTGNPQIVNINPSIGTDNTGYATASAKSSDGIVTSTASSAPERRGYLKFPLAVIPPGSTVSAATLKITNNGTVGSSGAPNTVRALGSNDPVSATAATIFAAVAAGNIYNTSVWSNSGQLTFPLTGTASVDLTNSIVAPGYFALGLLRGSGTTIYNFHGYSGGANAPVLTVTYANVSSFPVTVSPGTPATPGTISSSPSTVCENSTGNTFSIAAVTGASTYTWTVPAGWSITAGQGTTSITVTTLANNGNVTVTAGNSCGTSSAQSLGVTLQVRPTVAANPATQEKCSGTAITSIVLSNPNGVSGTIIYNWTRNNTILLPPGIAASGSANPITGSIVNNTGVQQLTTFTVSASANGCASTTSATSLLYINPNPTANAGVDQQICAAASTTIGGSPTASGGTPGYTYLWTAGVSNTAIANPTAPAGTYTVTVTDSKTCQASDAVTITNGSSTKTWIGDGTTGGGPNSNFNNPLNWSPAGVPGACNDVIMNLDVIRIANFFGGNLTIALSAGATIKSMAIDVQAIAAFSAAAAFKLEVGTNALSILNATSIFTHGTAFFAQPARSYISVGSGGVLTYGGNLTTTVANNCTNYPFYATVNNQGKMYIKGDANLGGIGNDLGNKPNQVVFDATGTQNITNSSGAQAIYLAAGTTHIGETNSPTVNLIGAGTAGFINIGNLNINNTSTLDIGTLQSMNRNAAGGTITMAAGSTMRVGRNTGGTPVNNFPSNFSAFSFSPTSTVEYYGTSAQTIYAPPVYGNLTLTNNSIKTAGNPLTVAGNLLINPTANFRANGATGWTHNIGGNWTNNGTFSYVGGTTNTINFNGNSNATISGSSPSGFYSMTIAKGSNISTILNLTSTATTAVSSFLTFTSGLFRIQPGGNFTHNGAGPAITANSGLHINGGNFNITNATVTNSGLFRISSGNGTIGNASGNSLDNNSGGIFDMSGGILNIAARLTFSTGVVPTSTITGGTANLAVVDNSSVNATLDMTAATKLNMNAGLITFRKANTVGEDIRILETPGNKNFTGGVIQIGTATPAITPAGQVFKINSAASLYDITVNNTGSPVARLTNQVFGSHNISINTGSTLDAATNNMNIKLAGNWVNDGIFLPGLATVSFNGAVAESISGAAINTNFYNLTNLNASGNLLSVNSNISVFKQLSLASGAKLHVGTGNITLKSNATNTANVDKILTNDAISYGTGNFIVERYIASGINPGEHAKSWQLLATPVRGAQTVKAAWQEGAATPNANPNSGFGTQITSNLGGSMAGANALGFDVYTAPGPTMKTYNLNSDAWDGIPNTNSLPISNKNGYMVFVRGDRSVTAFNQAAVPTILRTTGKLFMPSLTQSFAPDTTQVAAGHFRTIGNPYASTIDFTLVTKDATVDDKFYVWDPLLTNNYNGLGGYQMMSAVNGYMPVPGGNSKYDATVVSKTIQSGQAFFVHSDAGGGNVSFTENCKLNTSAMVFRPPANGSGMEDRQFFRLNLYSVSTTGATSLADGNLVAFDTDFSNTINADDAIKIVNPGENIAIRRNGKAFILEARKPVVSEDSIYYTLSNLRRQNYQLMFIPENMRGSMTAFLVDKFLNSTTPLSLTVPSVVDFSVTEDTGSSEEDRFYVIFKALNPVPVRFTNITAIRNSDASVTVNWKVQNEINIDRYEVELSLDGSNFNKVNTVTPKLNNGGVANYTYVDEEALPAALYYRISSFSNGQVKYSDIAKIGAVKGQSGISVYPNPVTGKLLTLYFIMQQEGIYRVELINMTGQVVYQGIVSVNGENFIKAIALGNRFASGKYQLKVTSPGRSITTKNLMIQ